MKLVEWTVYSDASFTSSDYPDYRYVKGENELKWLKKHWHLSGNDIIWEMEIMQEDVIRWLLYQQS